MNSYIQHIRKRIREGVLKEMIQEMRWIYRYSMRYKKAIVWYVFLGVFGTFFGLGTGIVTKRIIDAVTGQDTRAILPAAAAYIGMSIFEILMSAWSNRISAKIKIMVQQEIRSDVFGQVLSSDWEALSEYHSGDLLNRLNTDVNTVSNSVINWIPDFITSLVQFISTLVLILYYDPVLSLLALISAPVTIGMSRFLMRKIRYHNVRMLEANSELMAFNEESFQNLQYIKAFDLIRKYRALFNRKQDDYKKVYLDYNRFSVYTSSVMALLGMVVTGVCFGWSAYRLWTGFITYGTMTLFLQQSGRLSGSFSNLVMQVPNAINAATSAGRIMSVTQLPREAAADVKETEAFQEHVKQTKGVSVRIRKLEFGYMDGNEVFSHVSMDADPCQVTALVGTSGGGKTTMMKILTGLVKVRKGKAWLEADGKKLDISAASRRLFAYVPQGNTMMSGTIRENLCLIQSNATDEEIWKVLEETCADEFVKNMPEGLDTCLKERGGGLSEGQLQRLSIARALLCDAPILLLDEATSALDIETERRVLKNIMESARKKTCIVTTHRPSVLTMCSRVYQVSEQRIELLDQEQIRKMLNEF